MAERDYERLIKELQQAKPRVLPGVYLHVPSGNRYDIEKLIVDKETETLMVAYHDERPGLDQVTWTTTLDDWESVIEVEGAEVRKYQYCDEIGRLALQNNQSRV